jgi:hypothetical protein
MRAVSRAMNWIGSAACVFALLLASPGVEVSRAEQDFSWDPALEGPPAAEPASAFAKSVPVAQPGAACAAQQAPAVVPSVRGLKGMPLQIADGSPGDAELNSLNGRGYNIGRTEPSADLQKLLFEARRQAR